MRLAEIDGMSVGDFLRNQLNTPRVRKTKAEREKILQLARIGNNLNQVARWVNTYKHACDALQVNIQLAEIEEQIKCLCRCFVMDRAWFQRHKLCDGCQGRSKTA